MNTETVYTENNKPKRKYLILLYFYLILLMFILSVVATYTWFSLSRTPRVNSLSMSVSSRSGLELSVDGDSWGTSISFNDMVKETSPLRPVTWSEKDQIFYAANYNFAGRLTDNWQPLSDAVNSNSDTYEGYYVLGTFYARSSQPVTVSLTPAIEVEEGVSGSGTYVIGKPIWNSEKIGHDNAGNGAENAIRIGINVTYLDENGQPIPDTSVFYIYEPNCDSHKDGSIMNVDTPSIDGASTLVPEERMIKQTYSTWTESDPVQNGVLVHTFGEFEKNVELFTLKKDQKVLIKLYIWLEGQDVDCNNTIEEAQIFANIQFKGDQKGQSGLDPID